jgi:hypothetical protein
MDTLGIKTDNEFFFKALFPPISFLEEAKRPLHSPMLAYGAQTMGKTETCKFIVKNAYDFYGRDRVNAVWSSNIELLLANGIQEAETKPIQILIAEDITLEEPDKDALKNFYKIGHIAEANGMKKGLILTILTLHDIYSVPKHLRTFFNCLLACNAPTNLYDFNIIKSYLKEDVIKKLRELQTKKYFDHSAKAYAAYWFLGSSGFIKTELTDIEIPRVLHRWGSMFKKARKRKPEVKELEANEEEDEEPEGAEDYLDSDEA